MTSSPSRRRPNRPRSRSATRPTRRGIALSCAGVALAALGVVLDLQDLVTLGVAPILLVLGSGAWLRLTPLDRGRGALAVARRLVPNPTVRGRATTTTLTVSAVTGSVSGRARLDHLRVSEQAPRDLCPRGTVDARVARGDARLTVTYTVEPVRRGVYPLGPVLAARTDTFGVVRTAQPLGAATDVVVWPRTTSLMVRGAQPTERAAMIAAGSTTASWEDSMVREYVPGDDPRRVHWRSAARRGRLMVRAEEGAGLPPVTVVLDSALIRATGAPAVVERGEWAVELAASIAVSMLDAGHLVRLVPTADAARLAHGGGAPHLAVADVRHLLDAAARLGGQPDGADPDAGVRDTAVALRRGARPDETVVAVVGPLSPAATHAMSEVTTTGGLLAVVVPPVGTPAEAETSACVTALRTTGWNVTTAPAGTDPVEVWALLTEAVR